MTALRITARLTYEVEVPTSFAFSIVAARTPFQSVSREEIDISADDEVPWQLAAYGEGTHQLVRLSTGPGLLDVSYDANVAVHGHAARPKNLREVPFEEIPAEVLPFLNPSRYCESDKLGRFAQREFGDVVPGQNRVQTVTDWVTNNLVYEAGSTDGTSSTTDVLLQRAGVCRDFAHVAIALCRALGVPARYVSGYGIGVEPQDFHGFFEAYIGSDWYVFDPSAMTTANALARIGCGRDAADAAFATFVGSAILTAMSVEVTVDETPKPESGSID